MAKVKPMLRKEAVAAEESPAAPNLLGDLLKRQDEFLKPKVDRFEPKEPIHQKEVGSGLEVNHYK